MLEIDILLKEFNFSWILEEILPNLSFPSLSLLFLYKAPKAELTLSIGIFVLLIIFAKLSFVFFLSSFNILLPSSVTCLVGGDP